MNAEELKRKIIGTWTFFSWEYKDEQGNNYEYFGRDSKGYLSFDEDGHMSVQIMKSGIPTFKSNGIASGTEAEMSQAFLGYIAYFGKYFVEEPNILAHTVEGCLFPNWVGGKEIRYATLKDDFLLLTTPPVPVNNNNIVFYITWRKTK